MKGTFIPCFDRNYFVIFMDRVKKGINNLVRESKIVHKYFIYIRWCLETEDLFQSKQINIRKLQPSI